MKKLLVTTLLLTTIGLSAAAQGHTYTINGTMTKDLMCRQPNTPITKLYLSKLVDSQFINVDSTMVSNKSFTFSGDAPEVIERYFITGFDNGYVEVFLEPGNIVINPFDGAYPSAAYATGTRNNDIYADFKKLRLKEHEEIRRTAQEYDSQIPQEVLADSALLYTYKNAFFNRSNLKGGTSVMEFIMDHSDAVASLYIISSGFETFFSPRVYLKNVIPAFDQSLHSHPVYREMYNRALAKNMRVGSLVPDFTLQDPNGKAITLSDLRGKYVLLDFWASWCGPCRREIPYVKEVIDLAKGSDQVVVLSVSIDTDKKAWLSAIKTMGMDDETWLHASDLKGWTSPAAQLYGVSAIPKTFLINPSGKLIVTDLRGPDLVIKMKNIIEGKESYK